MYLIKAHTVPGMWSTLVGHYAESQGWKKGSMQEHLFIWVMSNNNQDFISLQIMIGKRHFVAYILNSSDLTSESLIIKF